MRKKTEVVSGSDAKIARLDITRPDNAAPDQTEVLKHGWRWQQAE